MSEYDKATRIVGFITLFALVIALIAAVTVTWKETHVDPQDTLVVGINTPFPPFEYEAGGQVHGFDIDIAYAVGEKLDRKVVFKNYPDFADLMPALSAGAVDMVISGMTITPQRSEAADFSIGYYDASQAILVKKDSDFHCSHDPQAADFQGLCIGYQELTTSQGWLEDNVFGQTMLDGNQSFGDFNLALQSLRVGGIDAIILDEPVAMKFEEDFSDVKVAGTIKTGEEYGIAVKKGDPQHIVDAINETIMEMKQPGEKGEASRYDQLLAKYFGGESQ